MSVPAAAPVAYAGEISPADSWRVLAADHGAKLVDVRTQAEWVYVGLPDLAAIGKQPLLVSWQLFPAMQRNEDFAQQLAAQGVRPGDTVLFICRSGVRSKAAAEFVTQLGYRSAWNVTDGFEGPLNEGRHRGDKAGWKAAGLPWLQS
ncbi:rhodanese-like domain-containing protein [Magnetospirillum sp. UT-4]|uniref:rhodanese-like domain-containing protein n=1 Tax=Magnetospirillum sp. UT-4 TaxID=2681467 RepID=UPI00137C80CC|nr:rhodanese-like domain-containing protein [Magnetospirillum sp. UT-4]CAA7611306.1 Rhodanese-related sulfurtransferase [Magnetospirillum sp. UT-4]